MIILDSDVLIDLLRGEPRTIAWASTLTETTCTTGISAMELIQGSRDLAAFRRAERLLMRFPRVWPSPAASKCASTIYGRLKLSHNLGVLDALIAATAIENRAIFYTFNLKLFAAVPQLAVQAPD